MQNTETNGEVIGFYGDVVTFSEDAKHHYTAVNNEVLRDFMNENATQEHLMIMYPQIFASIVEDMKEEIISINPQTAFKQIGSMGEFMTYVETGSHEIDRELHPVESIQMLNTDIYYNVIQRENPKVEEVVKEVPKEYVKANTIESNEGQKLAVKMDIIAKMTPEDFVAYSGLKGFDLNNESDVGMIKIVQLEMHKEFFQTYVLPSTLQTAKDNITASIPGPPAKSIKDGLIDGVEFVHELLGDKNAGHLEIELDCETRGECHPKVHRVYEDDNKKEIEVNERGEVILDSNSIKEQSENTQYQTNTQPFDSTKAAQETLADLNLTDFSQSNENAYAMEMD